MLAIIGKCEPSYKRDGVRIMDEAIKDYAFYEHNGNILAVERHYADNGSIAECVRDVLLLAEHRDFEVALLKGNMYNTGDTVAVTSTEEGSK